MSLNAPTTRLGIQIVTLLAYFPHRTRYDLMRVLQIMRTDEMQPVLDTLLRFGYIRHSRAVWGAYEAVTSEWSPEADIIARTPRCHCIEVDESVPIEVER